MALEADDALEVVLDDMDGQHAMLVVKSKEHFCTPPRCNPSPLYHCCNMAAKDEVMPEEKQLIQPQQVVRDECGFWTHPAWPDDGDECALPFSRFGEHGLKYCVIEMENDALEGMMEA